MVSEREGVDLPVAVCQLVMAASSTGIGGSPEAGDAGARDGGQDSLRGNGRRARSSEELHISLVV